jgi:hypothetical protein
MTLYALDDLGDAYAATRAFLFPFERGRWLRLAAVAFFVAGSTGTPLGFQGGGGGAGADTGTDGAFVPPDVDPGVVAEDIAPFVPLLVGLVGLALLLALAVAVVGSVMEFVLVESLREDRVAVREFFGRHLGAGLRLFGFRFVLGALGVGAGALVFGLTVLPLAFDAPPVVPLASLVVLGPLFVLVALVLAVASGFTTAFVVPVMLLEDRGVLSAWRRVWPTLRGQWRQFVVYALVVAVVLFVTGILAGVAVAVPVALLAAVFAVLVGVSVLAGGLSLATGVLVAVLAVVFVALVLAVVALVQAPIQTYVRYHALLVLGDADDRFDLIPEVRRSVRGPGGGTPGPTGAD